MLPNNVLRNWNMSSTIIHPKWTIDRSLSDLTEKSKFKKQLRWGMEHKSHITRDEQLSPLQRRKENHLFSGEILSSERYADFGWALRNAHKFKQNNE